jgi:hypothetical protein
MNTETVLTSGACGYWTDDEGGIYNGRTYNIPHQDHVQFSVRLLTGHSRLHHIPRPGYLHLSCVGKAAHFDSIPLDTLAHFHFDIFGHSFAFKRWIVFCGFGAGKHRLRGPCNVLEELIED